jgi:hypothetical protein
VATNVPAAIVIAVAAGAVVRLGRLHDQPLTIDLESKTDNNDEGVVNHDSAAATCSDTCAHGHDLMTSGWMPNMHGLGPVYFGFGRHRGCRASS